MVIHIFLFHLIQINISKNNMQIYHLRIHSLVFFFALFSLLDPINACHSGPVQSQRADLGGYPMFLVPLDLLIFLGIFSAKKGIQSLGLCPNRCPFQHKPRLVNCIVCEVFLLKPVFESNSSTWCNHEMFKLGQFLLPLLSAQFRCFWVLSINRKFKELNELLIKTLFFVTCIV